MGKCAEALQSDLGRDLSRRFLHIFGLLREKRRSRILLRNGVSTTASQSKIRRTCIFLKLWVRRLEKYFHSIQWCHDGLGLPYHFQSVRETPIE